MKIYNVHIYKENDGGFTAIIPDLEGCITYGETVEEAEIMVKEAIELFLEELENRGENISKKWGINVKIRAIEELDRIIQGLKEVKLIEDGKLPTKTYSKFRNEL